LRFKRASVLVIVVSLLLPVIPAAAAGPSETPLEIVSSVPTLPEGQSSVPSAIATGPFGFITNAGQFPDEDVSLYMGFAGGGIAFESSGVLLNLADAGPSPRAGPLPEPFEGGYGSLSKYPKLLDGPVRGVTVGLSFAGSNDVRPVGRDPVPGTYNYIIGDDPSLWRTGVRAYSEVVYQDLYEGIDLVYRMTGQGVKYEFVVAPGADPGTISVQVDGHESLFVRGGDLVIGTVVDEIRDQGLDVFYSDGAHERLGANFEVRGHDTYGFSVEDVDPRREFVIDPLVFATYLGTSGWDTASAVTVDDEGYPYVTGDTDTDTFPTTTGAYQEVHSNLYDVFVSKMDPDGSSMVWSTFIGGTDMEASSDIQLDDVGNVYVTGTTLSGNYPKTANAYQDQMIGNGDCFVSKLNPTGSRLLASSLIGGFWADWPMAMAVDAAGNMYIAGATRSDAYPTTMGAADVQYNGSDAFITKFNPTATDLVYSTFLGGSYQEEATGIVLDDNNAAYVVGRTGSVDFPVTNEAYQTVNKGGLYSYEAFVTKVDPDGTSFPVSTYLGGKLSEYAFSVGLDDDGDVHVMGTTASDDFPTTPGVWQSTKGSISSDDDFFVTQLDKDLTDPITSTYIGGGDTDDFKEGIVEGNGNITLCGSTMSFDYPVTDGAAQTQKGADEDVVVTKLSSNYTELDYSTFLGDISNEGAEGVATYGSLYTYVVGVTYSDEFPVTPGALQTKFGGNRDGFVAKLTMDHDPPVAVAGPDVTIDQHETVHFNGSDSWDDAGVANWTWSFTYESAKVELYGPLASWTFDNVGSYQVTLTVRDESRHQGTDTLNVTVRDITVPIAEAGESRTIRQGDSILFNGSGSWDNVGVVNWTWTFVYYGEDIVLYGEYVDHTFIRAGVFNISLTVRDAVGLNASDHVIIDVVDLTDPIANAGEDIFVDQHVPVMFNGSLSSDTTGLVNWTWSFVHMGVPIEIYGETAWFTFDVVGAHEVVLRVEDTAGNHALDTVTVTVRDSTAPAVDAGPDQEVDEDTVVHLDGTGSTDNVGITGYEWSFYHEGEDLTLSGPSPVFTFETPGVYVVNLTAVDAEANSGWGEVTITVRDQTPPIANAGDDVERDQGLLVQLDGGGSSDNLAIVSWVWTFEYDGAEERHEGSTMDFTFVIAGIYTVTLTVTDGAGHSDTDTATVTILDITDPVAITQEIGPVEYGDTAVLDGSASTDETGISAYTWTITRGDVVITLRGSVIDHVFNDTGDHDILLTVSDPSGNEGSVSYVLLVIDSVSPVIEMKGSLSLERGDTSDLDASGSTDNVGVVSWTWDIFGPDGERIASRTGSVLQYKFDGAGDHEVVLSIEDGDGNTATETYTVAVEGSPLWPYILVAILVAAVVVGLVYMRRRGDRPDTA
jgi:PKD repeat protein